MPTQLPTPLTEATVDQFIVDLRAAFAKIGIQLPPTLENDERRRLAARSMGTRTTGFVELAGEVMAAHPNILPRDITDADITAFPDRLAQYKLCTRVVNELAKYSLPFSDMRLRFSHYLRTTSDDVYNAVRRDDGDTPGLKPLAQRMMDLVDREPNDDGDDDQTGANGPAPGGAA